MISSLEAQSEVKQHLIISFMSQESLEKHGEGNQAALHYGQNGMCLAYVLLSRMDMILYDSICFFWYLCFGSLFLWLMIVWLIEDANMSSLILNRCDGFISPPAGKCSKCFSNTLFFTFLFSSSASSTGSSSASRSAEGVAIRQPCKSRIRRNTHRLSGVFLRTPTSTSGSMALTAGLKSSLSVHTRKGSSTLQWLYFLPACLHSGFVVLMLQLVFLAQMTCGSGISDDVQDDDPNDIIRAILALVCKRFRLIPKSCMQAEPV